MKTLVVIPVRLGSSRFPGKPLAQIRGRPMVQVVYENAIQSLLSSKVVIATCDVEIAQACDRFGATTIMTSPSHTRATERTHEAVEALSNLGEKYDLIVMLQGDEPCISGEMIDSQIEYFQSDSQRVVTNLIGPITSREDHENPNTIKVLMDRNGKLIYLSREPIPGRGKFDEMPVGKQVCSISFTPQALDDFVTLEEGHLERSESIDMLRFLEAGREVFGVKVQSKTHAVDIRTDIPIVERLIEGLSEPGL
jgi:3-deoxy-manno-octulosonate cytidylyltransferase (CMP-KDO synthetase)